MRQLMLNTPLRVPRNRGYFNMIADEFIKPSTRAENLQEPYFKAFVKKQYSNKTPEKVISDAKKLLRDSNNPVYFNPSFEKTLSLAEIADRVLLAEKGAMNALNIAKKTKDELINDLAKTRYVSFSKSNAIKEVENSISEGRPSNDIKNSDNIPRFTNILNQLYEYKAYWAVAAAYTSEYNKRVNDSKAVTDAIEKGDVAELKALRTKVNVAELKTNIDDAIKTIEEAKKAEEERKKAEEEARKKLAEATTDEEKKSAQAELDAVLGRVKGDVKSALGNKTLIYVGIGLVVLVGAYFVFKKRAQ